MVGRISSVGKSDRQGQQGENDRVSKRPEDSKASGAGCDIMKNLGCSDSSRQELKPWCGAGSYSGSVQEGTKLKECRY